MARVGVQLVEVGNEEGYPVFHVQAVGRSGDRRPKNLIFASPVKPDIRIIDAVDNDVEIASNAESVLVYDRAIGQDGLRWADLQQWWKETRNSANDDEAKSQLYRRLLAGIPSESPPQQRLFRYYHEVFGSAVTRLPALLPEVWLHWDPKTVRERGARALLNHRMDFLLLLPHHQRIVVEVDGVHHYADEDGQAKPGKYAASMRADRLLKLSGYEVYRFGGAELTDGKARESVSSFFHALYRRYGIPAD